MLITTLFVTSLVIAATETDCAEQKAAVAAAEDELQACLALGIGECADEMTARDAAVDAAMACADGVTVSPIPEPTAAATPAATATPTRIIEGKLALLVEGVSGAEHDAVAAAAHEALTGATLVEAGAVRAARTFLGGEQLDDAAAQKLRSAVTADRLLVLQIKADGAARFIAFRLIDPGGPRQRFAEATQETVAEVVKTLVADLPPIFDGAPAVAPVAVATPRPPKRPFVPYVDVNAFAGTKQLDTREWAPIAAHVELGALTTIGASGWPVHAAADFYFSFAQGEANGIQVRARTMEAAFGARRSFDLGLVRPHVGGGILVAVVSNAAAMPTGEVIETGIGPGAWLGGGAIVRLGSSVNLGVQARYSFARVELTEKAISAGGFHVGATVGFGFGSATRRPAPPPGPLE